MEIARKLDEGGKAAWIALMIAAFVIFWPAGLAILAYMFISGRMGCMSHRYWNSEMKEDMRDEWRARREEWRDRKRAFKREMREMMRGHMSHRDGHYGRPSGNTAFDEYKAETLKRLEEEQAEFADFLDNLRKSRDKAEFDQFMKSRRDVITPDDNGEGDRHDA